MWRHFWVCEICLAKGSRRKDFSVHHVKTRQTIMQTLRSFLIVTVITLLTINACKKRVFEDPSPIDQIDLSRGVEMRKSLSKLSRKDQILEYNMLSHHQKFDVWKDKISQVLTTDLSRQQREIIQELYEYITPVLFEGNEAKFLSNNFVQQWLTKAVREFSPHELNMMFGRIEDYVPSTKNGKSAADRDNGGGTDPEPPAPNCHCKNTLINSCEFYWMECENGAENCNSTSTGCGFLWQENCGGRCVDR